MNPKNPANFTRGLFNTGENNTLWPPAYPPSDYPEQLANKFGEYFCQNKK
jgi:hypothetical protein